MSTTLYLRDEQGPLGSVTIDDAGKVTKSDSSALEGLVALAEAGGKTAASLEGYFNGYYMVSREPDAAWPEEVPQ